MGSDLKYKTSTELRETIEREYQNIVEHDLTILQMEKRLEEYRALVKSNENSLSKYRMWRNGHHQRMVWAKNYLLMRGE